MWATRGAAAHLCRLLYGPPRRVGGGAAAAAAGMRPRAHRGGTWPVATRVRKAAGTHCEPEPRSAASADHRDVSWIQKGGGGGARRGRATPWGQRVRVGHGAEGGGATGDNRRGRGHDLLARTRAERRITTYPNRPHLRTGRTSLACSFCMKQLPLTHISPLGARLKLSGVYGCLRGGEWAWTPPPVSLADASYTVMRDDYRESAIGGGYARRQQHLFS